MNACVGEWMSDWIDNWMIGIDGWMDTYVHVQIVAKIWIWKDNLVLI